MTATREFRLEDWQAAVGTVTGQSDVIHIDQAMINAFADVSQDWQPIHVDPKAAAASPFGTTIAHGFLVVSLLAPLGYSALPGHPADAILINRGFDKLRFVAPVPVGSDIQAEFLLASAEVKGPTLRLAHDVRVTLKASGETALAARWLTMIQYGAQA